MKKLLLILLLAVSSVLTAQTTYYVSTSGNDNNNGTSPSTPWQTITRVNTYLRSTSSRSGDVILFKRGDIFSTTTAIRINKSGISLGAYGTGNLPEITGFATVSSWSPSPGNNVYSSVINTITTTVRPNNYPQPSATNLSIPPINMVSINGVPQILGRTPNITDTNGGYRNFVPHRIGGRISTDSVGVKSGKINVRLSPLAPIGALNRFIEVVFRTTEWNVYRAKVDTISVDGLDTLVSYRRYFYMQNGVSVASSIIDTADVGKANYVWGYFYQNDSTFLDQFGEWHYDYPTKRLRVYFGNNSPISYSVKIATADTLIAVIGTRLSGISITNLKFTGSNLYGLLASNVSTTIQDCEFDQIGGQAIGTVQFFNTTIRNNTISNCLQAGIYKRLASTFLTNDYTNLKINKNTIKNIATYPGMGSMNQGLTDYAGISIFTFKNTEVDSNTISKVGGDGINFQGSDISIGYNKIDSFCAVYQDHAGIYTFFALGSANPDQWTNRRIHHNFVHSSLTSPGGTPLKRVSTSLGTYKRYQRVNGIYGDGTSNNLLVDSNVLWKINSRALIFNGPTNVQILDNFYLTDTTTTTVSSFAAEDDISNKGVAIRDVASSVADTASNVTIKRNVFYLFKTQQDNFAFDGIRARVNIPANSIGFYRWIKQVGTIDSNYVNLVTTPAVRCTSGTVYLAFTLKQMQDSSSQNVNAIKLPDVTKDRIAFYPNYTPNTVTVYLNARYQNVNGVIQERSIQVPPYSYYFGTYVGPLSTPTTITNRKLKKQ